MNKTAEGWALLLDSLELETHPSESILQSTLPSIPRTKRNLSPDEVEAMIKAPFESSSSMHDVLVKGLVELCKVKPVGNDAVQWLGEWLLENNPNKPQVSAAD